MLAKDLKSTEREQEIEFIASKGVSDIEYFDEGGQGKIYFGTHPEYGKVAVKLGKGTLYFNAFENECERYRELGGEAEEMGLNLPKIYEISDSNEYIIMEKIDDGKNLKDIFDSGVLSLRERLVLVHQGLEQAQILYDAFDLGHNDLKLENVMQRPDHADYETDKCHLIDLGSAMTDDEVSSVVRQFGSEYLGSKRYMPPDCERVIEICEEAGEPIIPYLQGYSAAVMVVDAALGEDTYHSGDQIDEVSLREAIDELSVDHSNLASFIEEFFENVGANQGYTLDDVILELDKSL